MHSNGEEGHSAWAVIVGWFIANLLAAAALSLLRFIYHLMFPFHVGMLVSSMISGLPIGLAQWIALRRVAPVSTLWILSVSVGLPAALLTLNNPVFLGAFGFMGNESIMALTLGYVVVGLLVGLIQWMILRGHFAASFIWPLVSSVGLGTGLGIVLASDLIYRSGIASIVLVVLVYAFATGLVILRMTRLGLENLPTIAGTS